MIIIAAKPYCTCVRSLKKINAGIAPRNDSKPSPTTTAEYQRFYIEMPAKHQWLCSMMWTNDDDEQGECVFCGTITAELSAIDSVQVRCNVREFGDETFTVWRCARCGSLHATEPIDPDRYYQHYATLCRLEYYSFKKIILSKRIKNICIRCRTFLNRGNL